MTKIKAAGKLKKLIRSISACYDKTECGGRSTHGSSCNKGSKYVWIKL